MKTTKKVLIVTACLLIGVPAVFQIWSGMIDWVINYRVVKFHESAGDRYIATRSYEEAMTAYLHARDIDQNNARILEKVILARLHLAAESLEILTRLNPNEIRYEIKMMLDDKLEIAAVLSTALGNILLLEGKIVEAIGQFKEALKADPKYPFPHLGLGKAYSVDPSRRNEAVEAYKTFIKARPENFDGQLDLGQLYLAQGKAEEAAPHLLKACGVRDDYRCRVGLAHAYIQMQKYQEALDEIGKAARLRPDSPEPNELLIDALMGAGMMDRAETLLRSIIATGNATAAHAFKLAISLSRQGKYAEALQLFDQFLQQRPDDFMALFEKAGALEKIGRNAEALNLYQAILNMRQPDDQQAAQALSMFQQEARKKLGK